MKNRERTFRELAAMLERGAVLTRLELYNDVTAEQQVAISNLCVALGRAAQIAHATALAFETKPGSAPDA